MQKYRKKFYWTGYQYNGFLQNGIIEAQNKIDAQNTLKTQGILLRSMVRKRTFIVYARTAKPKHIASFTHQLSSLLQANISLINAFDLLIKSHPPFMRHHIQTIKQQIENGLSIAEALRHLPRVFNDLFCDLVYIGEQSGTLSLILKKMAHHQQNVLRLKRKVIQVLTYPLFIFCVTVFSIIGLLLLVIPQFEHIFTQFGSALPSYTKAIIACSHLCQNYGMMFLGISFCLILSMKWLLRHRPAFAIFVELKLLKLPFFGLFRKKIIITRFAHTISIAHEAGLPLLRALEQAALACGNQVYYAAITVIKTQVSQGLPLHLAMKNSLLFPDIVIQLVAIGEESATLAVMFNKIANDYEDDLSYAIDTLSGLLEPIIMAILGLLIGSIVIAIYLPIINLSALI